jgi:hypothetical protein
MDRAADATARTMFCGVAYYGRALASRAVPAAGGLR